MESAGIFSKLSFRDFFVEHLVFSCCDSCRGCLRSAHLPSFLTRIVAEHVGFSHRGSCNDRLRSVHLASFLNGLCPPCPDSLNTVMDCCHLAEAVCQYTCRHQKRPPPAHLLYGYFIQQRPSVSAPADTSRGRHQHTCSTDFPSSRGRLISTPDFPCFYSSSIIIR